jgi:1-acyl-sn-glycerol-3-phosphate acyltransferase
MDPWHYDPAKDLDQSLLERLRQFPREPDMLVYGGRLLAALLIRGWLKVYHRLRIVGRENLPKDRSCVLVANHASHLDALCLLTALPFRNLHRTFPAAARDYFFVSTPRLLAAAVVTNALPFDRQANARQSLSLCRQLLENPGNILLLFPEGTRSATGTIGEFKPGVGLLLAGTNHPVLPCYLQGTHAAWPKGCWLPRPRRIQLTIGQQYTYGHLAPGKMAALQICNELRDAVTSLARNAGPVTPSIPREKVS